MPKKKKKNMVSRVSEKKKGAGKTEESVRTRKKGTKEKKRAFLKTSGGGAGKPRSNAVRVSGKTMDYKGGTERRG